MGKAYNPPAFDALDDCHAQMRQHLTQLLQLAQHLAVQGADEQMRAAAHAIETFFSTTARRHHAEEESKVFASLLVSGDPTLVAAVRRLEQDHGWIEENWRELAPRLRALASGNGWIDGTEFLSYVEVFQELVNTHMDLEDALIYPASKAGWDRDLLARTQRLQGLQGV